MTENKWSPTIQEKSESKFIDIANAVSAQDGDPVHREFYEYLADLDITHEPVSGSLFMSPVFASVVSLDSQNSDWILQKAIAGDIAAYEICQLIAVSYVRNNARMPNLIQKISEFMILSEKPSYNKHQDRKNRHTRRDRLLYELVLYLEETESINPTRNDSSKSGKENSAVDYVVRTLAKNGYPAMNFATGKRVWLDSHRKKWARVTRQERFRHFERWAAKNEEKPPSPGKETALGLAGLLNFANDKHNR